LRHNILLWLDEQGETHGRMLWQRLNKVIRVYPIPEEGDGSKKEMKGHRIGYLKLP